MEVWRWRLGLIFWVTVKMGDLEVEVEVEVVEEGQASGICQGYADGGPIVNDTLNTVTIAPAAQQRSVPRHEHRAKHPALRRASRQVRHRPRLGELPQHVGEVWVVGGGFEVRPR